MEILRADRFLCATPYRQVVKVLEPLLRMAECLDLDHDYTTKGGRAHSSPGFSRGSPALVSMKAGDVFKIGKWMWGEDYDPTLFHTWNGLERVDLDIQPDDEWQATSVALDVALAINLRTGERQAFTPDELEGVSFRVIDNRGVATAVFDD